MEKPKNLFYRTNNVSRSILDEVIGDMDKIAELPPREGMDFEDPNFSREVEYGDASAHNEGLNMIFKKLGIYQLDMQYKQAVADSVKKDATEKEKGLG